MVNLEANMTLIINELSMNAVRSPKSELASFNNKHAGLHHNAIQDKGKLIHEHSFIPARAKKGSFSFVYCTSCGKYYCELHGKPL
jgi:hypothetical protein